jgi:hypothetical protein
MFELKIMHFPKTFTLEIDHNFTGFQMQFLTMNLFLVKINHIY